MSTRSSRSNLPQLDPSLYLTRSANTDISPTMGPASFSPIALQHVNFTVPKDALPHAKEFYGDVMGLASDLVPHLQRDTLQWSDSSSIPLVTASLTISFYRFRIGDGPQQVRYRYSQCKGNAEMPWIHIAFECEPDHPEPSPHSSRHACFGLASQEALLALQHRIWDHKKKGGPAAALQCDEPGSENSGSKVSAHVLVNIWCDPIAQSLLPRLSCRSVPWWTFRLT